MSFSNIVDESLTILPDKIEQYVGELHRSHKKCDYIEILTLLNSDEVYKSSIIERFFGESLDHVENAEEELETAEINDQQENEINNLFDILRYRSRMFGNGYPFIVNNDNIKLKPVDELDNKHKLYITLLCCANLEKFSGQVRSKLTTEFEEITYIAIKQWLPQITLKRMGSNSDYAGNTKTKLRSLARDLNISTCDEQINNIDDRAFKEKGVDLFGWYKFIDKIPNQLMLSVQCACGKKTDNKINEAENYHNYLRFRDYKIDPIIILSVPKASSLSDKFIKDHLEVMKTNSLFFDRFRLMEFCLKDLTKINDFDSYVLANKLIEIEISVLD